MAQFSDFKPIEYWMPPLLPGLAKLTNSRGETYGEFRKKLTTNYVRILLSVTLTFIICVFLSFLLIEVTGSLYLSILGIIPLSLIQLRLLNVIHEGAHYLIAPSRKLNDNFCNLISGWFFVVDVDQYRITHTEHHRNLGREGDPENSHMDKLDLTWLASAFSGIRTLKTLKIRNEIRNQILDNRNESSKKSHKLVPLFGLSCHITILFLISLGDITAGEICWFIATYAVTPGLGMLRNLLEHRYVENVDPTVWEILIDKSSSIQTNQATTRTFTKSKLSYLYGSMGFTRHLLHHWDPSISFQNLKKVHLFILDSKIGPTVASTDSTFTETFKYLWKKA